MQSQTLSTLVSSLFDNPYSKLYGNLTFKNKLEYGNFTKSEWEIINSEYSRFFCSLDVFDSAMDAVAIVAQIDYLIDFHGLSNSQLDKLKEIVNAKAKKVGKTLKVDYKQRVLLQLLRNYRSQKTWAKRFNKREVVASIARFLVKAETLKNGRPFYYMAKVLAEYVYPQVIERIWLGQYKPKNLDLEKDLETVQEAGAFLIEVGASKADIEDYILDLELSLGKLSRDLGRQPVSKYVSIDKACGVI